MTSLRRRLRRLRAILRHPLIERQVAGLLRANRRAWQEYETMEIEREEYIHGRL